MTERQIVEIRTGDVYMLTDENSDKLPDMKVGEIREWVVERLEGKQAHVVDSSEYMEDGYDHGEVLCPERSELEPKLFDAFEAENGIDNTSMYLCAVKDMRKMGEVEITGESIIRLEDGVDFDKIREVNTEND